MLERRKPPQIAETNHRTAPMRHDRDGFG